MLELDPQKWAEQQFGTCQLGDARRTKRVVAYAAQVAADPSGSTPEQAERWSDLKAVYRLLNQPAVTFQALAEPHWRMAQACFATRRHVLLIDDTTDVCFRGRETITGMGIIRSATHQGFLLHSALSVDADCGEVLGLAAQTIRHRQRVPKQHARQRLKRHDRESRLWNDVIDMVAPPPAGVTLTHVCDRGADNFEVYCHLLQQQANWVIRVAQLTRTVISDAAKPQQLRQMLARLPVAGVYKLQLRGSDQQPSRLARLEVRFTAIRLPRPKMTSRFVKSCGIQEIPMWVVEVREVPPQGRKKGSQLLHWVLYTSFPVTSFEQARAVIGYYEQRWVIEEFHKALKTGCQLEARQYTTAHRLEAVTAVLAVTAARLLQLKTLAQQEPQRAVEELVPRKWVRMLIQVRRPVTTIREFCRELAGLGGFLGRKCDGEPGWITIWRGFDKLQLLVRGASASRQKSG